jgi:hypothetical protein
MLPSRCWEHTDSAVNRQELMFYYLDTSSARETAERLGVSDRQEGMAPGAVAKTVMGSASSGPPKDMYGVGLVERSRVMLGHMSLHAMLSTREPTLPAQPTLRSDQERGKEPGTAGGRAAATVSASSERESLCRLWRTAACSGAAIHQVACEQYSTAVCTRKPVERATA